VPWYRVEHSRRFEAFRRHLEAAPDPWIEAEAKARRRREAQPQDRTGPDGEAKGEAGSPIDEESASVADPESGRDRGPERRPGPETGSVTDTEVA
jgi:hypothetical protein